MLQLLEKKVGNKRNSGHWQRVQSVDTPGVYRYRHGNSVEFISFRLGDRPRNYGCFCQAAFDHYNAR